MKKPVTFCADASAHWSLRPGAKTLSYMNYEALGHCLCCCPDCLGVDMAAISPAAAAWGEWHGSASEGIIVDLLQCYHIDEWQILIAVMWRCHGQDGVGVTWA